MSLSKDALDTITATAIAASGAPLDTHVPAILVPKGYELTPTEHLQVRPARFRGAFTTHSIAAFADYVKCHANNDSAGFIDQRGMSARVLFDLGSAAYPGHCEHRATLQLSATAPYAAVKAITGTKLDQRNLTDFIEDWIPHLAAIDGNGENINLPAAIAAIRHMRIETKGERQNDIGDFNAKRSVMEEIEAKSKGQLPRALSFSCIPYEHLDPITICLRIAVLTDNNDPVFKLHWVNEGAQFEVIAANFREVLTEAIDGTVPLTLGTFSK